MAEYLILMHGDAAANASSDSWEAYIGNLKAAHHFAGGSEIGTGKCFRKAGSVPPVTDQLTGFIRIVASSFSDAEKLLAGNPHYEAGGTVEIRELPVSD